MQTILKMKFDTQQYTFGQRKKSRLFHELYTRIINS